MTHLSLKSIGLALATGAVLAMTGCAERSGDEMELTPSRIEAPADTEATQPTTRTQTPTPRVQGKPPEAAYAACKAKREEATCMVSTPRGSLQGTCRMLPRDKNMSCVPNMPDVDQDRPGTPPPPG